MGISSGVISLFTQLKAEGFFDGIGSVIEFGAQTTRCRYHAPVMKKCLEKFGVSEGLTDRELGRICKGASRDFYEAIGMEYASLDTSSAFGAFVFDLNFDAVPEELCGKFDLLTNFGTSEHVFNQYNNFKTAHDFVRKGGAFMHFMPFLGYVDHGYYSFQPCFYNDLAGANDYDILGMWLNPDGRHDSYLIPWTPDILKHLSLKATNYSGLFVLMRKTKDEAFKIPFQGRYENCFSGDFEARYTSVAGSGKLGIFSPQALMESLSGYDLQRELRKRYLSKLGKLLSGRWR
ncbi:MAG TPA: hypothetical protein QF772_12500 [Nitrospinaceae bacterium]|nr:hypothetical protein [Nitrospinaceae bacterium]